MSELINKPREVTRAFYDQPELTESHLKVLEYIVERGESYYNQIRKSLLESDGLSNATVVTALKRLQGARLIQLKREEAGVEGRGRSKKIFGSTLKGLIRAFNHSPPLWDNINSLAELNKDALPLVFGKWNLFINTPMFRSEANFTKYEKEMEEDYSSFNIGLTNSLSSLMSLNLFLVFKKTSKATSIYDEEMLRKKVTFLTYFYLDKYWLIPITEDDVTPFSIFFDEEKFNQVKYIWSSMVFGDTPREVLLMTIAIKDAELKTYFTNTIVALRTFYDAMNNNAVKTEAIWKGIMKIIH